VSYNIDSTEILSGSLTIAVSDLLRLHAELRSVPEVNFIGEMKARYDGLDEKPEEMHLPSFWWCGECSGTSYDKLLSDIIPCLRGKADIVLTWEGGDSVSGLRIEDGKCIECDVVQTLQPRTT